MKITLSDMCRGAGFERMRTKTFWAFCHRPFSCAQKKITSRLIGYKYYDGDRNTQIRLSVRTMRESFEKPLGTKSAFDWQCRSGQENLPSLRHSRAYRSRAGT